MTLPEKAARNRRIVAMYRGGMSGDDIARSVGLNRATVFRILSTAAATEQRSWIKWTPEMDAELRALADAGIGLIPASERIGVCKQTVIRRRNELGLAHGIRGWHGIQANRRHWGGRQGVAA